MDTVTKINAWNFIDVNRIDALALTEILLQSGYVITGIDNVSRISVSVDALIRVRSM